MHPGWVDTPGVSSSLPRFEKLTRPLLRTPDEGADTILWLVASPEVPSGGFWLDRRIRPANYLKSTVVSDERRDQFLADARALAVRTSA